MADFIEEDPQITEAIRQQLMQQQAMQAPNVSANPVMTQTPQQVGQSVPQAEPRAMKRHSGPIKSFLTDFLYGAGQAAKKHVGLPTDQEAQQVQFNQNIARQNADASASYRAAQGEHLQAQAEQLQQQIAPYTFGANEEGIPEQFRGLTLPTAAANALRATFAKNLGAQGVAETKGQSALQLETLKQAGGNPRDHAMRSVGGRVVMVSKRDGSVIKDLGPDTALITGPANAVARARAMAAYGVSNVMDEEGNPTAVSRLTQLQTGAPTVSEKQAATIAGDKLGTATYLSANNRVEKNLNVLHNTTQRGLIAHALNDAEQNPGAAKSIIDSYLQQGLTPEAADLTASLLQMSEFGPTFKKLTGNGGSSTDSLRATIKSNQPNAARSLELNRKILKQDRDLAAGALRVQSMPNKYSVPAKGVSAPAAPSAPKGFTPF